MPEMDEKRKRLGEARRAVDEAKSRLAAVVRKEWPLGSQIEWVEDVTDGKIRRGVVIAHGKGLDGIVKVRLANGSKGWIYPDDIGLADPDWWASWVGPENP